MSTEKEIEEKLVQALKNADDSFDELRALSSEIRADEVLADIIKKNNLVGYVSRLCYSIFQPLTKGPWIQSGK